MISVGRQWLITELEKYGDTDKGTNKEMAERLAVFGIYVSPPNEIEKKKITTADNYPSTPTDGWLRNAILDSGMKLIRDEKREQMTRRLIEFGFNKLKKD